MDIRRRLAKNMVALRAARGWSQEDLAEASGLHRTYVSGLERCVRNPTILVLERLAKALRTPASALIE